MSKYTSVILLIPRIEDEYLRIAEVNSLKITQDKCLDLQDLNVMDILPTSTFAGTYNNFDTDKFLNHLQENVRWECPEYIQVIIQEEGARNCKIYSHAGKKIIEDAEFY